MHAYKTIEERHNGTGGIRMQQTAIDPIQYDTLVQNERVHRSL